MKLEKSLYFNQKYFFCLAIGGLGPLATPVDGEGWTKKFYFVYASVGPILTSSAGASGGPGAPVEKLDPEGLHGKTYCLSFLCICTCGISGIREFFSQWRQYRSMQIWNRTLGFSRTPLTFLPTFSLPSSPLSCPADPPLSFHACHFLSSLPFPSFLAIQIQTSLCSAPVLLLPSYFYSLSIPSFAISSLYSLLFLCSLSFRLLFPPINLLLPFLSSLFFSPSLSSSHLLPISCLGGGEVSTVYVMLPVLQRLGVASARQRNNLVAQPQNL